MKKAILMIFYSISYLLFGNNANAQSDTYVVQGQTNPCATVQTSYNLVAVGNPQGTSGCTISWSVTGGAFQNGSTSITSGGTGVQVTWNNNATNTGGRISAELTGTNCHPNVRTTYALDVTIKTLGTINGIFVNGVNQSCNSTINVPCGTTPITFSIVAPANATNYQWFVPANWTINSNSNTSITVTPALNQPS
jgi:hypothetical protein